MDTQTLWTLGFVFGTFALYIGIAIWSRAGTTGEFYVAGKGVHPIANGMATAADWMSAASFISMAGIIAFAGYFGSVYLMGWTGGYVLLALLLAPYLRKFGKFTVPDFVGDRYYSQVARVVAVVCAIFVSFTYVAGQMSGVGIVMSRFLQVPVEWGVVIGMGIVFVYAVLGGMKGITYTQVAQYCVLIFAFTIPAIFISMMLTGWLVPQVGFVSDLAGDVGTQMADGETVAMLERLNELSTELGFREYTKPPTQWFGVPGDGSKSYIDVIAITLALMVGTAGLPHVIVRFYTVPRVRDARVSAFWALLFIAILYTSAPAVAAFARTNLFESVSGAWYSEEAAAQAGEADPLLVPDWFKTWETTKLVFWHDKDGDGRIRYDGSGKASTSTDSGRPIVATDPATGELLRGSHGQPLLKTAPISDTDTSYATATDNTNELFVNRDIMVLANPEIAKLPHWVIALVAAGGLAAALSTAAGLLLVISTSISHDLLKRVFVPSISERNELWAARIAAGVGVFLAGYLGINPPGFVAQVVALAFGLAASSFFPVIVLGIFDKRMNREGAIAGMVFGITFTAAYIVHFKFRGGTSDQWWWGISPEGIGSVGMLINFGISLIVSRLTPAPPKRIVAMIEEIRVPKGAGEAHEIEVPPAHLGEGRVAKSKGE